MDGQMGVDIYGTEGTSPQYLDWGTLSRLSAIFE